MTPLSHGLPERSQKVSKSKDEFHFHVDPQESDLDREQRWDAAIIALQEEGFTIDGDGPDGDYPIRNEAPDGSSWTNFWENPEQGWVEVYRKVPLRSGTKTVNAEEEVTA